MGLPAFWSRFLKLLEIGPASFNILSSVCSLLFVCGLGWADGRRKIVLIGPDRGSRFGLVVGFRGVGLFVASLLYFHGLGTVLSIPGVIGIHFGF